MEDAYGKRKAPVRPNKAIQLKGILLNSIRLIFFQLSGSE